MHSLIQLDTRFNYGKNAEGDLGADGSFMQFLSITDPDDAWRDFELSVMTDILAARPGQFIDPTLLPQLFPVEFGSATISNATTSP